MGPAGVGSARDGYDHAMAERLFATLERELLVRQTCRTHLEAHTTPFESLEVFDNHRRRHLALGYLSPDAYKQA